MFAAMNCNWNSAFVLDPMRTRPKLGKDLSGVKGLRGAVIVMIG